MARGQARRRGRTLVLAVVTMAAAACTSGQPFTQPAQPQSGPAPQTVAEPVPPTPTPSSSAKRSPAKRPYPRTPTSHATARPRTQSGGSLPLRSSTGSATQVITVVAAWSGSTTAVLQAWTAAGSGRWVRHGPAISAHLGAQGLTWSPSEGRAATPIGSFTLTRSFGYYANPGTRLPYLKTTTADWWISQAGPFYNTHQRCTSGCSFVQGAPNEHLYYETPFYNYAVVIDYNTPNTGQVTQGAGSGFFLHVTDGTATAGCVAVPQGSLVWLMQWLNPADRPRILIGIG